MDQEMWHGAVRKFGHVALRARERHRRRRDLRLRHGPEEGRRGVARGGSGESMRRIV